MDSKQIIAQADGSLMPTYAHFNAAIVSGKGATLTGADGRTYIDFTSGIGVNALGYGDPDWVRAISDQAARLQHISNLYYAPSTAAFAEKITQRTGFERVFLCNSGAEANECAVKTARKYAYDHRGAGHSTVITLINSFHGRSMVTLTATGQEALHPKCFAPYNPGFKYVPAGDVQALEDAVDDTVCAVMLEPIQGEGGVMPMEAEYVRRVRELCDARGLLLIFDEVQTGVGRTGKLYAWEHYGVRPDILTSAKGIGNGLPIGLCLAKEAVGAGMTAGMHGSTFGGNPVACAGACVVLDKLDDALLAEVTRKGNYLRERLSGMKHVKAVRGMGMMLGVELDGLDAKAVAAKCVATGLLILTAKTLLRLLPPLVITDAEMERGLKILNNVLEEE